MLTQGSDRDKQNLKSSNFLHIGHCYGSGSGIRCLFDPLYPDPDWGVEKNSGDRIQDEHHGSYL